MQETFDIFAGSLENDPIWLASSSDLTEALGTMDQLAGSKPGKYFVYNILQKTVVAAVDTDGLDGQSGRGVVA